MKPLFKSYLKKVCSVIAKKNRVATYVELRSHMMSEFDELVVKGVSVEEACKTILISKPNPYWLGYKMRRAQQSFLRRNAIRLFFVFAFMVFMIAGQYITQIIQRDYMPLVQQSISTAENETAFEADLKFLETHKDKNFFTSARTKSADDYVYNTLSKLPLKQYEFVFRKLKRQMTPPDVQTEKLMGGIDSKQIETLKEFDYVSAYTPQELSGLWQGLDSSMYRKVGAVAAQRGSVFLTNDLADVVLLYTYRQCVQGECLEGLQTLRHVARLIYSSNSLAAQSKALVMLRDEEYFVKKFKVSGYTVLDAEFLNANERVTLGWSNIHFSSLINKKFAERWWPYMRPELGMCASVSLLPFGIFLAQSDLLGKPWFLEEDFTQRIENERAMMNVLYEKCDMKMFSHLASATNSGKESLAELSVFPEVVRSWVNEASIPYIRQLFAFNVLKYSAYSTWKVYERLPPKVTQH